MIDVGLKSVRLISINTSVGYKTLTVGKSGIPALSRSIPDQVRRPSSDLHKELIRLN